MNRLLLAGVALGAVAIGGAVIYYIWRNQLQTIVSEAKQAATVDILNGAAQQAAAADEALASARDPDAIEKELSKGTM